MFKILIKIGQFTENAKAIFDIYTYHQQGRHLGKLQKQHITMPTNQQIWFYFYLKACISFHEILITEYSSFICFYSNKISTLALKSLN